MTKTYLLRNGKNLLKSPSSKIIYCEDKKNEIPTFLPNRLHRIDLFLPIIPKFNSFIPTIPN